MDKNENVGVGIGIGDVLMQLRPSCAEDAEFCDLPGVQVVFQVGPNPPCSSEWFQLLQGFEPN